MNRRGCLIGLALLGAILLGLYVGASWYLDQEQFRQEVEQRVEEETGLDVSVGSLSVGLSYGIGVQAEDITVREAPGKLVIASIDAAGANVEIKSLFLGKIRVREIWVSHPHIRVIWESSRRTNIHRIIEDVKKYTRARKGAPSGEKTPRKSRVVVIDEARVSAGRIEFFEQLEGSPSTNVYLGNISKLVLSAEGRPWTGKVLALLELQDHKNNTIGRINAGFDGDIDIDNPLHSDGAAHIRFHQIDLRRALRIIPGIPVTTHDGSINGDAVAEVQNGSGNIDIDIEVVSPLIVAPFFKEVIAPGDFRLKAHGDIANNKIHVPDFQAMFAKSNQDEKFLAALTGSARAELESPEEKSIRVKGFTATVTMKEVDGGEIFRHVRFSKPSPIKTLEGKVDISLEASGSQDVIASRAHIDIRNIRFEQPKITYGELRHERLTAAVTSSYDRAANVLTINNVSINTIDFQLVGSGKIEHVTRRDRIITATLRGEDIPILAARKFILISNKAKALKDLLFERFEAGTFKTFEARIHGGAQDFKDIKRKNSWEAIQLEADAAGMRVNFGPAVFTNATGRIALKGPGFTFNNLTGRIGSSSLRNVALNVEPTFKGGPKAPTLTVSFDTPLDIRDLRTMLASDFFKMGAIWNDFVWKGKGRLQANLITPLVKGAQFGIYGRLNLKNAYLDFNGGFAPMWKATGPILFKNRTLYAPDVQLRMGPTFEEAEPLRMEVKMDDFLRPEFDINMRADKFTVEHLWNEDPAPRTPTPDSGLTGKPPAIIAKAILGDRGAAPAPPSAPAPASKTLLTGTMRVGSGSFRGLPFTNLDAALTLAGPTVYIHALEFKTADGVIRDTSGQAWLDTRAHADGRVGSYHFWPEIEKANIKKLQESLGVKPAVEGRLTMKGEVYGTGLTLRAIANDLSGELSVRLERGNITKSTVATRILKRISLKPSAEGFTYNDIRGKVRADHGLYFIYDTNMNGLIMDVTAKGVVDMPQETQNLEIQFKPIGVDLPILKNFTTQHAYITGTWKDPVVDAKIGPLPSTKRSGPKSPTPPAPAPRPEGNPENLAP